MKGIPPGDRQRSRTLKEMYTTMSGILRRKRRERIRRQPFPAQWLEILDRNFPRYRRMPSGDQAELRELMQIFLAEKHFEGAGGLDVTDEIRVTVAAQACLLLLHRETDVYPGLHSIVVYPSEYAVPARGRDESGIIEDNPQVRLGETAARGAVVIAWDAAARGGVDVLGCRNVVFHEFAHELDAEEGSFNGAPVLPHRSMYSAWARVLGNEFRDLQDRVARRLPTDLDPYGASNPAEFFAVATECFFQQPVGLYRRHPELYAQLASFYRQDPAKTTLGRRSSASRDAKGPTL